MPRVTAAYRERQTDRILQVAGEYFARNGSQAVSIDEVIVAVGMSSSTLYRYFPGGKRSSVREVLTWHTGPLVEQVKQFAESEALPDFRQGFIEALILFNYERDDAKQHVGGVTSTS